MFFLKKAKETNASAVSWFLYELFWLFYHTFTLLSILGIAMFFVTILTATVVAANESVNAERRKQSRKCSVTAAVGINYFAVYDFSVFCGINLKLLCVTEVQKDLSVFVSYCNFHCIVSFAFSVVKDFNAFLNCTAKRMAVKVTAIASATGSAV